MRLFGEAHAEFAFPDPAGAGQRHEDVVEHEGPVGGEEDDEAEHEMQVARSLAVYGGVGWGGGCSCAVAQAEEGAHARAETGEEEVAHAHQQHEVQGEAELVLNGESPDHTSEALRRFVVTPPLRFPGVLHCRGRTGADGHLVDVDTAIAQHLAVDLQLLLLVWRRRMRIPHVWGMELCMAKRAIEIGSGRHPHCDSGKTSETGFSSLPSHSQYLSPSAAPLPIELFHPCSRERAARMQARFTALL